jgi:RLL motif containing protein 1
VRALADAGEIAQLVVYLEDRCVRAWEIERRAPLRAVGDAWPAAFAGYLADIGCPLITADHPFTADAIADYVKWLVSRAVDDVFQDKAAAINAAAAAEVATATAASASTSALTRGSSSSGGPSAEAEGLCRELAALCHVNVEGRSAVETVQACHRALRQRLLPAAAKLGVAVTAPDGSGAAAAGGAGAASTGRRKGGSVKPSGGLSVRELTDLATFPLGFGTGDEVVDRAAAILRMLYVTDLRELQDAVNDVLVTVQEFTANPKTDSSLGVVGR